MAGDIIDLWNPQNPMRVRMRAGGPVPHKDLQFDSVAVPDTATPWYYTVRPITEPRLRQGVEGILPEIEEAGYTNVYSGIYEAVRNAFHHGNQRDGSKKILLAYELSDKLDVFVADEGIKGIHPEFWPFIDQYRREDRNRRVIGFYNFIEQPEPSGHSGVGTATMHSRLTR